jgi:hypothetical protein
MYPAGTADAGIDSRLIGSARCADCGGALPNESVTSRGPSGVPVAPDLVHFFSHIAPSWWDLRELRKPVADEVRSLGA